MTADFTNISGLQLKEGLEEIIMEIIEASLKYEGISEEAEISVTIVNDSDIRKINNAHRNIDSATDVLSFPMIDFEKGEKPPEKGLYILGDIIISIETAMKQAEEYGHSIEREIGFLTAHSMLHLMGYDHMEPSEEREMFKKQEEILNSAGLFR